MIPFTVAYKLKKIDQSKLLLYVLAHGKILIDTRMVKTFLFIMMSVNYDLLS
jgi:hypothetical protein